MNANRQAVAAFAASALVLVGGGAALASAADGKRSARCEARVQARIDAAEKAGRISPERADRLRERVDAGKLCARRHIPARIAAHGMLGAAADFLDLDRAELRSQLPGTSLAGLAEKQGKSVAALKAAMIAPAKARIEKAAANERISQARAERLLERLELVAGRLATKVFPST